MIAFVTLFLGLVVGVQTVEVVVGEETAKVEIRLDGQTIAQIGSPPWRADCDLGSELAPRRLEALAFDADGTVLGRSEQILNGPRPAAVAEITIQEGHGSRASTAGVQWESRLSQKPATWRVSFDGDELAVKDPRHFELPSYDPGSVHFLRAELEFGGGVSASAEATFGGRYGSEVAARLFAVVAERSRRKLSPEQASSWLVGPDGEPLEVVAVDEGKVELVVVVDPSAAVDLAVMASRWRLLNRRKGSRVADLAGSIPTLIPLEKSHRLHLMRSRPEVREGGSARYELYPLSDPMESWQGGFLQLLLAWVGNPPASPAPRFADAVAAAGLQAAAHNGRRAVVLLLGSRPVDASQHGAVQIRRYLASLRIPLEVWSTAEDLHERSSAWGRVRDVSSVTKLDKAFRRLSDRTDRQRVIWVEGIYLPQEITSLEPGELLPAGSTEVPAFEGEEQVVAIATEAQRTLGGATVSRIARLARARELLDTEISLPVGSWVLYTDVDGRSIMDRLERVAGSLEATYRERFGLDPGSAEDEALVLFGREEPYRRYEREVPSADGSDSLGSASDGVAALFVGERDREEVLQVLVHELTHLLNDRVTDEPPLPWLEEGLATELAFSRFASDGRLQLGTLSEGKGAETISSGVTSESRFEVRHSGPRASLLDLANKRQRKRAISLADLLELSTAEFFVAADLPMLYASSGFFVRFLLDGDEQRWREGFQTFLQGIAAGGASDRAALEAALGIPIADLESDFDRWLDFTVATVAFRR